ncbi:hypothetical protein J4Q44_G00091590 [Coregonus suidteri]|uniref:Uncharacterized protein n=1 Tax=Coregonus suidteri TaxID=861788 RepID=A0AAN8M6D4_9TELE
MVWKLPPLPQHPTTFTHRPLMPSVLPTGRQERGQRPRRIPRGWVLKEERQEPSWEMLPRYLRWLGWHTRSGCRVVRILHTLFGILVWDQTTKQPLDS